MKDNIETKVIGNRKIVLELRFDHKVLLSDKKGAIVDGVKQLGILTPFYWEIGLANISIFDNIKKNLLNYH